jgi:hypothetical protein
VALGSRPTCSTKELQILHGCVRGPCTSDSMGTLGKFAYHVALEPTPAIIGFYATSLL